jgi:hypothetical protein
MKILFLVAALTLFEDAPLPPSDAFCEDIRALARGADEEDPFRSLRSRGFRPRLGRGYCFFSDAGGYTCGHNLARNEETHDAYAARIQACLTGAVRMTRRDYLRHEEIVRRGRFEARVVEHGRDRGHVGRTINIYIRSLAEPANRPGL